MAYNFIVNSLIDTDSYKISHRNQYPPNTDKVYSYIESRGGDFDKTVFFGLQPLLQKLAVGITKEDVIEADKFFAEHVGRSIFHKEGFMKIVNEMDGKLPIKIKAVPEGKIYPTHTPMITIESTDPRFHWITTYIETMLLRIWYPITVATQSYHIKQIIKKYLEMSSDDPEGELLFKLHDFGSRGCSSAETAAIGASAHLVNFLGSDTCIGVKFANDVYYNKMSAFSIPAMEHSTVTAWGKDYELSAYRYMMKQYPDAPLIAMVTDSYNQPHALDHIFGVVLKKDIKSRNTPYWGDGEETHLTVLRLDSGDPKETVLQALEILAERFGFETNSKGYKVLNSVRVLQGDGVDIKAIEDILEIVTSNGFSATNINFGMGKSLLQDVNRDTNRFAMKASYIEVNGEGRDIFKDPVGDPGKASKAGRLDRPDLITVFENGRVLKEYTLEEVRENTTLEG